MAGAFNSSKFSSKQFSHDIFFDGALLSNTRASLVVELIKYFLYERQQIPLPVDELGDQVAHEENVEIFSWPRPKHQPALSMSRSDSETDRLQIKSHICGISKSNVHSSDGALTDVTNVDSLLHSDMSDYRNNVVYNFNPAGSFSNQMSKAPGSKVHPCKSFRDQKTKVLVSTLSKLFDSLQNAFESCPEIEQVAVLLGGTVMNPKESYLISFPPPSPEADCIPLLTCKRTLFQQIISEDILGTMSANISPTNMMVLVSAPRSCPLKGFLPKQSLRSPKTGAIIHFNFHCNYLLPVCYDLTIGDGDFEMSGIVPLDINGKEKTVSLEKNVLVDICTSDENRNKSVSSSDENRATFLGESDENRTQFLSGKEFTELDRICDYEHHMQLELNRLKLTTGNEHFHVATPGIGGTNLSLRIKPHLVSSTPILKNDSPIARSETSHVKPDCIWYQSPHVIKGFRIVDRFQNHPTCS